MHEITYNLDDLDKIINKPKIEIQGLNENTIILLVLVCLLFILLMLIVIYFVILQLKKIRIRARIETRDFTDYNRNWSQRQLQFIMNPLCQNSEILTNDDTVYNEQSEMNQIQSISVNNPTATNDSKLPRNTTFDFNNIILKK